MGFKLLNEHHFEFLSLKGGCTGSSESTLVKMPHCWKSYVTAQLCIRPHGIAECDVYAIRTFVTRNVCCSLPFQTPFFQLVFLLLLTLWLIIFCCEAFMWKQYAASFVPVD